MGRGFGGALLALLLIQLTGGAVQASTWDRIATCGCCSGRGECTGGARLPVGLLGAFHEGKQALLMCGNNLPDDPAVVWVVLAHESAHVMQFCNGGNLMPAAVLSQEVEEARQQDPNPFHELQLYTPVSTTLRLKPGWSRPCPSIRWWPGLKTLRQALVALKLLLLDPWLMVVDKPAGLLSQPGLGLEQSDSVIPACSARSKGCAWSIAWIATPRGCCCWPGVPTPCDGSAPCLPNAGSTSFTRQMWRGSSMAAAASPAPWHASRANRRVTAAIPRGVWRSPSGESERLAPMARGSGCARSQGAPISCGRIWLNWDTRSWGIPSTGMPVGPAACICMPSP